MSLKKTDLVKNLAKKLDGKMKSAGVPQRFAQGSSKAARPRSDEPAAPPAVKLVPLACRLPADLLAQVREHAVGHEGGINAIVAEALARWLEAKTSA